MTDESAATRHPTFTKPSWSWFRINSISPRRKAARLNTPSIAGCACDCAARRNRTGS